MIRATNQVGFNVEQLTPEGWIVADGPYSLRQSACEAMVWLAAGGGEWRVYAALVTP